MINRSRVYVYILYLPNSKMLLDKDMRYLFYTKTISRPYGNIQH